jgi:NAD dependent epimerase/dehydratase family enzyme
MAIVLGDGPALTMLARAARFGMGGAQHDGWWFPHRRYRGIGPRPTTAAPHGRTRGEQKFSWIHIDDLLASVRHLDEHAEISGPVNLAAPGTSTNRLLMTALREAVGTRVGLPAYRWMLEPGLWILRQESELVLKSRWAVPETLLDSGFSFAWPELEPAIQDLVRH